MNLHVPVTIQALHLSAPNAELLAALALLRKDFMATITDAHALLIAINDVTNTMAGHVETVVESEATQLALIQSLRDQIAAGGPVTQAQLDQVVAELETRKASLELVGAQLHALAADPANPVPELPVSA